MRAIDNQMRRLAVKRVTYRMQFLETCQRIDNLQQGPVAIMAGPLVKHRRWHIEIHHPAGLPQPQPVLRLNNGTSTSGQDDVVALGQFVNGLCFTAPESLFSLDLENRRNGNTGTLDNFVIGIKKWTPQPSRQLAPDCRLPGTHQADQINVSTIFHARILADYRLTTKTKGRQSRPFCVYRNKKSIDTHLVGDHARRYENQQLATRIRVVTHLEQPAKQWDIP